MKQKRFTQGQKAFALRQAVPRRLLAAILERIRRRAGAESTENLLGKSGDGGAV